jgi:hypothetical protein
MTAVLQDARNILDTFTLYDNFEKFYHHFSQFFTHSHLQVAKLEAYSTKLATALGIQGGESLPKRSEYHTSPLVTNAHVVVELETGEAQVAALMK